MAYHNSLTLLQLGASWRPTVCTGCGSWRQHTESPLCPWWAHARMVPVLLLHLAQAPYRGPGGHTLTKLFGWIQRPAGDSVIGSAPSSSLALLCASPGLMWGEQGQVSIPVNSPVAGVGSHPEEARMGGFHDVFSCLFFLLFIIWNTYVA